MTANLKPASDLEPAAVPFAEANGSPQPKVTADVEAPTLVEQRDLATGRFLPGNKINTKGRVKGVRNKATLARQETARREFERATVKAARIVVNALDSPNEWARLAASKAILDATRALDVTTPDVEWLEYLTPEESERLWRLVRRAKARMPENDGPGRPIDVTPTAPRPALPAPGDGQPTTTTPREDEDAEEWPS